MKKQLIAIATADLHLRDDIPEKRIDDYEVAQWRKLGHLIARSKVLNAPILIAGDIFHKHQPSMLLLRKTINFFKMAGQPIYAIAGQHDIPWHSEQHAYDSGFGVLLAANVIKFEECKIQGVYLNSYHYNYNYNTGQDLPTPSAPTISMCHMLSSTDDKLLELTGAKDAKLWSKSRFANNLILVGDNHQTFEYRHGPKSALVYSPGSMMRMSINQIEHQPSFGLIYWDGKRFSIVREEYPITNPVFSKVKKEKAEVLKDILTFISKMKKEKGVNFRSNLQRFLEKNEVDRNIQAEIWDCFGEKE